MRNSIFENNLMMSIVMGRYQDTICVMFIHKLYKNDQMNEVK